MSAAVVLYGATGFAGRLTARALRDAGLPTVLAGRSESGLRAVGEPLGLAIHAAGLDDVRALEAMLESAVALVNCAGPFAATQGPLVDACLRTSTHYLDIAGEVPEYQAMEARNAQARAAGVMLLAGAGFGCVPTDCLAAHVASLVPRAERLEIAFKTVGGVSRGTAQTLFGGLHRDGVIRRDGVLVAARPAAHAMDVDFGDGDGPTRVVTNPWRADLVTTGHSTSVPNVEAFVALPAPVRAIMRHGHRVRPLLDSGPWQGLVRRATDRMPDGPDETALDAGRSACWARAVTAGGSAAVATLQGPDAYRFTALTAALCARLVLDGQAPAGYQTPVTAFGADVALDVPGVALADS